MSSSEYHTCPSCTAQVPYDYIVCPFCGTSLAKIVLQQKRKTVPIREIIKRFRILLTKPLDVSPLMDTVAANPDRRTGVLLCYGIGMGFIFRVFVFSTHTASIGIDALAGLVFWLSFILIGGLLAAGLVYITWLIMGGVTQLFSRILGGKGTFDETICIIGYGFFPLLLGQTISSIFLGIFLPGGSPDVVAANPLTFIANLILIPFLGWFLLIVGTGIEKVHLLRRTEAFLITTAVTVLFALISIFPLLPEIASLIADILSQVL
ncbi:MAG: YIP1 family protein [Candidatus Hodarchaeota archaeon]